MCNYYHSINKWNETVQSRILYKVCQKQHHKKEHPISKNVMHKNDRQYILNYKFIVSLNIYNIGRRIGTNGSRNKFKSSGFGYLTGLQHEA